MHSILTLVKCLCEHNFHDHVLDLIKKPTFNSLLAATVLDIVQDYKAVDSKHVAKLYEQIVRKDPHDEQIWLKYIRSQLQQGNIMASSSLYLRALTVVRDVDRFVIGYENLMGI